MLVEELQSPVSDIAGVGEKIAKTLAGIGICTAGDLLKHYPRSYEDLTQNIPLERCFANPGGRTKVHTKVTIVSHAWFGYGRMKTLKLNVTDGATTAVLVAFNRAWLENAMPPGASVKIKGTFSFRYGELQSSDFDKSEGDGIFPLYPLTAGIGQAKMRSLVKNALRLYAHGITSAVPEKYFQKHGLLSKQDALGAVHLPQSQEQAQHARQTLVYEELFQFQLGQTSRKLSRKKASIETKAAGENGDYSPRQKDLILHLPFSLTDDQQKVITEINADIDRSFATDSPDSDNLNMMARLLQGDVGSGKTLVALFACLRVLDWGGQSAFLAPTEMLSRQHAENTAKILSALHVRIAYLTGNIKSAGRLQLLKALKSGEIDIVIGTHALFSRDVEYANLRLAVIDEQHRFGVMQRNSILQKGQNVNMLMMSATPIPRTLALTVFGDLDVSVIRSMPQGRLPIKTYVAFFGHEGAFYESVRKELRAGHQAYFVYPLIGADEAESDENGENAEIGENDKFADASSGLKSAQDMFVELSQTVFPEFKCALVHSKVKEDEQHRILSDFQSGEIRVLVATTVVEVGVDNPNATCMVIEHAERFALAALHQLRGRVGRGSAQSHCILVCRKNLTDDAKKRMIAIRENTDGFIIAEKDLEIRGPGEISGIRQSGYLVFDVADPIADAALLESAGEDALEYLTAQAKNLSAN
ncbi:MAG: ATP-dependent DNA helicase RecG [Treponemataceae bacterium]|nr:MAG: ATP-dependent DNA helicase RecG [Treponemataceae bacterium]